jgi:hypothetical protein
MAIFFRVRFWNRFLVELIFWSTHQGNSMNTKYDYLIPSDMVSEKF